METAPNHVDGKQVKERKRKRWLAKQDQETAKKRHASRQQQLDLWLKECPNFVTVVSKQDAERFRSMEGAIDEGDSQRALLLPYMDLQDGKRATSSQQTNEALFIAEGTETVRLLLQQLAASNQDDNRMVSVKSVFVKPSVLLEPPVELIKDIELLTCDKSNKLPFHLLIGEQDVQSIIAGFTIARGALACGVIPTHRDEAWMMHFLRQVQQRKDKLRLLALDDICDTANMGSIIRCASAFGVDAILLSQACCDAWYRKSIRVSMGHVFRVPIVRLNKLTGTLQTLSLDPFSVTSYAAVVDQNADIVLENAVHGSIPDRWCCVVGNEGKGISQQVVQTCTYRIRIQMEQGVDSLSVPIAAGILLHGLKERESRKNRNE